jgi:Flp pilus assembly protein TadG
MNESRRGKASRHERQGGQSLVEIAFGLIFLLVMLAGVVDVGRALFARAALLDAAEEGALYGSYQPADVSGIEKRISYDFLITTPFMGTVLGSQTFPLSASSESLILAPGCD